MVREDGVNCVRDKDTFDAISNRWQMLRRVTSPTRPGPFPRWATDPLFCGHWLDLVLSCCWAVGGPLYSSTESLPTRAPMAFPTLTLVATIELWARFDSPSDF
jgi:hypothetical protein